MHGRPFLGPGIFIPDAGVEPDLTDSVRVTQYALEALVSDEPDAPPIPDPDGGGEVPDGVEPDAGVNICNAEVPVAWWEIQLGDGSPVDMRRYAKVPINVGDPKEPRVEALGTVRRSLSNVLSEFQSSSVSPVFIDVDRALRGLEDSDSLVGSRASAYVSSEAELRLDPDARRRVYDGVIVEAAPESQLRFRVQVRDFIGVLLDAFQKRVYPSRVFNLPDFPNMGNAESDPLSPGNPKKVGTSVPVGYGFLSDENASSPPDPQGVVPAVYTGKRAIAYYDGALWDEYVFFGHAPGPGEWALFIPEGPTLSTGTDYPSRVRITASSGVVEYLFPGTAAWAAAIGPENYRDFNGRRYTVCYAFGPRSDLNRTGQVPLVANIPGIEDQGDGTGLVVTDLFEQILHALINWFLPETPYQIGRAHV